MTISRPRGTNDLISPDIEVWQYVEELIRKLTARYGYAEIRTPVFEHTELFQRGVGEATDIVEKEMYTFRDRADRSLTLRPEGTAAVVRAYLENKINAQMQPSKLYYLSTPIFRYERPQAGRYRQHHQFGVEAFGSQDPALDAEIISLALELLKELQLDDLELRLNSMGCPNCRTEYREAVKEYYKPMLAELCSDCQRRYEVNPLRLIDCKVDREAAKGAPRLLDYLCDDCKTHFDDLKGYLDVLGISYTVDPGIVRGLDYYTKTVFEIVYKGLGAQDTIVGGGRYDGLVETLGGKSTAGVGFGMGLERLILTLKEKDISLPIVRGIDVFVAIVDESVKKEAIDIMQSLRRVGLRVDTDYLGRSLKAQLRQANKFPARYAVLVAATELEQETVNLKDLEQGIQQEIKLEDLARVLKGEKQYE